MALDDEHERWRAPQIDIGPIVEALDEAGEGSEAVDVELELPQSASVAGLERMALVDDADRLARQGVLLSIPAVPEIGACRRWLFGQIALQAEGAEPVAWSLPQDLVPEQLAVVPTDEERAGFDDLGSAVVVADDTHRLVHVSAGAAALLGWEAADLEGRRLTTVVPPRLREAHLAGFTRYQLTHEPRILDQWIRLPALRRDGSEVEVELTISSISFVGGRSGFLAVMERA
jgi:PAS domain S-box-containing protein